MLKSEMKYVGVDVCVGGWLGVGLDNGRGHEVKGFMEFADLVAYFSDACFILVDMPIGLNPDTQWPIRPCDTSGSDHIKSLGRGDWERVSLAQPPVGGDSREGRGEVVEW